MKLEIEIQELERGGGMLMVDKCPSTTIVFYQNHSWHVFSTFTSNTFNNSLWGTG